MEQKGWEGGREETHSNSVLASINPLPAFPPSDRTTASQSLSVRSTSTRTARILRCCGLGSTDAGWRGVFAGGEWGVDEKDEAREVWGRAEAWAASGCERDEGEDGADGPRRDARRDIVTRVGGAGKG